MLRFKRVSDDGTGRFDVAPNHTINRNMVWERPLGWQYSFTCSCGWQGQEPGRGAGKSNRAAEAHVKEIWGDDVNPTWEEFTLEVDRDGETYPLPITWVLAWIKERERDNNTVEDAVNAALDAWLMEQAT